MLKCCFFTCIEKDEVGTLQFVPVPYNAPNFTGSDDAFSAASLPCPFKFGNLSYSTAYVICILAMHDDGVIL